MTERSPGTAARYANAYKRSASSGEVASLRLDAALLTEIKQVGDEEGLSQSDTIRLLLRRGLRASDKSDATTIQALQAIINDLGGS